MMKKTLLVVMGATTALAGCAAPPELPPQESMQFTAFKKGGAGALTAEAQGAAATTNVDVAAAAVGLVTLGVDLALLTPRLVFAGTVTEKATHDGNDWKWHHVMPLAGWQSDLTGRVTDKLELEMRITGLRGDQLAIKDFLWYTGAHQHDAGNWTIYDPAKTGPVVSIDWARTSATDRSVTFTNVTTAAPESGDVLKYAQTGELASMTIHDAKDDKGNPADFSVVWHLVNGSGKMTRNATGYCWDTLAAGQVDMPCPAGDYPAP